MSFDHDTHRECMFDLIRILQPDREDYWEMGAELLDVLSRYRRLRDCPEIARNIIQFREQRRRALRADESRDLALEIGSELMQTRDFDPVIWRRANGGEP